MAASMVKSKPGLSDGKDEQFGYEFAVDGLMTVKQAATHLAVSTDTIQRRCAANVLRWWKDPESGYVRVCRRSVSEYVRRGEM
jgi:excisionase family DNA binding protein